ncbi:MAG TPA: hypothetical protein VIU87_23490, partial [Mycobacterium sp.]
MTEGQARNLSFPINADQARIPGHRVFLSTVGRILHRTPDTGQDHPHIRHAYASTTAIYTSVSDDYRNTLLG